MFLRMLNLMSMSSTVSSKCFGINIFFMVLTWKYDSFGKKMHNFSFMWNYCFRNGVVLHFINLFTFN